MKGVRLALFLLPFLALSACRTEHEWHQKLTLTVETPAGERTGAAVVEVRALFGRQPMSQAEVQYGYTGEATVVEVAPGKYLFALLGGTEERFACAAGPALGWGGPWLPEPGTKSRGEWLAEVPRQAGKPPIPVPQGCLPLMVTFADITDPKTVQRVDPENLAASFGPGVSLKAVTLAVTEEPVTEGKVEAVLGDLAKMGRQLDPATRIQYPADFPEADIPSDAKYFDVSSFKTGLYK